MSDLIVTSDADYRETTAAKELCDKVGGWLAHAYPGYRWRIEPHPHPTRPFVDVRLDTAAAAVESKVDRFGQMRHLMRLPGYAVKPWLFYSDSSLKAEVLKAGGTMLEVFNLSRRRFEVVQFVEQPRRFGLLVMPTI